MRKSHAGRRRWRRRRVRIERVDEFDALSQERDHYRIQRAVALFGDYYLGSGLILILGIVIPLAMYEHDHVRILLDRARVAQVAQHLAVVSAALRRAKAG